MPFTLAHPCAIIPLLRRVESPWYVLALVVGSAVPDAPYYVHAFGLATAAHTARGLVIVCIPVGLAILGVSWLFLEPLLFLLPTRLRSALSSLRSDGVGWHAAQAAQLCLWLLAGACTHVAWDSFTHRSGWCVQSMPLLRASVALVGSLGVPRYQLLQHASTLVGLALVTWQYRRWVRLGVGPRDDTSGDLRRRLFWLGLAGLSGLFGGLRAIPVAARYTDALSVRVFAFQATTQAGGAFAALVLVALILVRFARRAPRA